MHPKYGVAAYRFSVYWFVNLVFAFVYFGYAVVEDIHMFYLKPMDASFFISSVIFYSLNLLILFTLTL